MNNISVIVPVFLVEKYLEDCVTGILNQTLKDFTLILVDDGSTDNSAIICDEYAKADNRVIVVHKKNGGLSDARNTGIEIASGEYISFCDGDDIYNNQMLEILFEAMSDSNADIAISQRIEYTEEPPESFFNEIKSYKSDVFVDNYSVFDATKYDVSCCNKLWKKYVFDDIRFPVGRLSEDRIIMYHLLYNRKVVMVDSVLYFYRYNPVGITKAPSSVRRIRDDIYAYDEVISFIENHEDIKYLLVYQISKYVKKLEVYYHVAINEHQDYELANEIKHKLKLTVSKHKIDCNLNYKDYPDVWLLIYPNRSKVVLYANAIKNKIHR